MAAKKAPEPAVRKSFIVTGGIALGAAVLGFVLVNFVFGGGGGGAETATELATLGGAAIPIASAPAVGGPGTDPIDLTPGGRDPFVVKVAPDTGATSGSPSSTSSTSAVAPPAPAPVPAPAVTSVAPPAPAAQPAPQEPAPQPASTAPPRPVYGKQTIAVLAIYSQSADIRIDDTLYEGAHARDELTERFNLDGFTRGCFYMKDMYPPDAQEPERFKLCRDDTVTR